MLHSFSEFVNEATASGSLEYNVAKRILAEVDDDYDNKYLNWMAWVRPMVNQLEVSFDYGQVVDGKTEEPLAIMFDAKVKFAFNRAEASILDSSGDSSLLIDLELFTPSELIENMYLQVVTTYINLHTNEETEHSSSKTLIPLSPHEIKRLGRNADTLYDLGNNIMHHIIRVGLKNIDMI
jgi:hypothetical protein